MRKFNIGTDLVIYHAVNQRPTCVRKMMMVQQKILVPVGVSDTDLNGVYYALALAVRIRARVYILRHGGEGLSANSKAVRIEKDLIDLINSARKAGLTVSDYIACQELKKEVVALIRAESIDVLVFGAGNGACKRLMPQIKDTFSGQIIQVKERDHISYL